MAARSCKPAQLFLRRSTAQMFRYVYRKGQLHNVLAPALPKIVGELVPPFLAKCCWKPG